MPQIEVREPDAEAVFGSPLQRDVRVRVWPDGTLAQLVVEAGDRKWELPVTSVRDDRGVVDRAVDGIVVPITELPEAINRLHLTMWVRDVVVIDPTEGLRL